MLIFYHHRVGFNVTLAADEVAIQNSMMSYWGTFAWNGSPNNQEQVCLCTCTVSLLLTSADWPAHKDNTDLLMTMQAPAFEAAVDVRASYCDFWDKLGYNF
jgi:hypothetical protein